MAEMKKPNSMSRAFSSKFGGEGGIRTPGGYEPTPDFKSGAFNRALPPLRIVVFNDCVVENDANIKDLNSACKGKI
tara:strand:+ start:34912 stop:35139 length:228 start_codon:yes stop_codon:yes gene_type:complete